MSYEIRQLSLGGVLDQAIAIVKNHFGVLLSIMLMLIVPFSLLFGFIYLSKTPPLPPQPTHEDFQRILDAQRDNLPLFIGVGLLYAFLIYPLANAAVIQAVARLYLGEEVTAVSAIQHAFRRFLPLVWTSILMMAAIWVGFLLLIIPGIIFSIWFGLSQHVTVLENISGAAALRRSKQLVNPLRGQFLALGVIVIAISMGINWSANLIPQPHVQLVVSSLLNSVSTILWTAALVVFYFSARCAVDNFDLDHLAESIGEEPALEGVPG